jgi:hypothetical protein
MGQIVISTEPHELVINGTTIMMQGDPSSGEAWSTLLDLEVSYETAEQRDAVAKSFTEALAGMAETEDDGNVLKSLGLGIVTLKRVAQLYVETVTGFPTKPSKPSTKR